MRLRDYQLQAIQEIKSNFQEIDRQYIEMPTGSGKTVTFLSYAKDNHRRILIIVPSKELLKQVYETSLLFFHKNEISRKGSQYNEPLSKVHICIINSLRGKYLQYVLDQYFDLIIIDEAHHSQSKSYQTVINGQVFAPKILGVTATPDRLDGKLLNEILHKKTFKVSIEELISKKYLCDIEGFSVKTNIDLSDVDDHNADFSIRDLYKNLSNERRNNLIVDICEQEMKDRKTLLFCINIAHSREITELLKKKQISAEHIDGKMKDAQKNAILSSFRNGEISVLCNCQLLSEGFDEPSIDGVILARPTKSRGLFLQMIGRGLRSFQGKKNCKIIDIIDNHKATVGISSVINESYSIESFTSIQGIKDRVSELILNKTEFTIEKTNLLFSKDIESFEATDSMELYLKENDILYFEPISFDEASFLIWKNELKKEFLYGSHN